MYVAISIGDLGDITVEVGIGHAPARYRAGTLASYTTNFKCFYHFH